MKYIVAFNRNRDFYQVPLALYERGMLQRLVTDLYTPQLGILENIPPFSRFRHRRHAELPSQFVTWNLQALKLQIVDLNLGTPGFEVFKQVDSSISQHALDLALEENSGLLLYSHYAYQAFTSAQAKYLRKGLFMFHPHTNLIKEILQDDYDRHPEVAWSMAHEEDTSSGGQRHKALEEEWRLADFIICASSFTAHSLVEAGCPPEKVNVVPYGIDIENFPTPKLPLPHEMSSRQSCSFLFVGQGVQRKGLHHLLKAWSSVSLPHAELTIIASRMDPGIAALAGPNVKILGKQSNLKLRNYFLNSDIFVMPSLVEGFGLVYLEALAAGCYCIGSRNSGFPDLRCPPSVGQTIASNEQLEQVLIEAYKRWEDKEINRFEIHNFAKSLTWENFRRDVRNSCTQTISVNDECSSSFCS